MFTPIKNKIKLIEETNVELKQLVVNFIYYNDNFDISKFRFKIIESENDLSIFQKQTFYISPNIDGIQCLFVNFKINDICYSFIINRKTLAYNVSQINPLNITLYSVDLKNNLCDINGSGTIFDGVFVNPKMFVITDIYVLNGNNLDNLTIEEKMKNSNNISKLNHNNQNIRFNFNYVDKLENMFYVLKKISSEKNMKGLIFLPKKSGTKLIYICSFNYNDIVVLEHEFNEINIASSNITQNTTLKPLKKYTYQTLVSHPIFVTFKMNKTNMPDVYKLYLLDDNELKFIDIAYIPTIELSKYLLSHFKDNTSHNVDCKFDKEKNKWQPFQINNVSVIPNNFKQIKNIILIE